MGLLRFRLVQAQRRSASKTPRQASGPFTMTRTRRSYSSIRPITLMTPAGSSFIINGSNADFQIPNIPNVPPAFTIGNRSDLRLRRFERKPERAGILRRRFLPEERRSIFGAGLGVLSLRADSFHARSGRRPDPARRGRRNPQFLLDQRRANRQLVYPQRSAHPAGGIDRRLHGRKKQHEHQRVSGRSNDRAASLHRIPNTSWMTRATTRWKPECISRMSGS